MKRIAIEEHFFTQDYVDYMRNRQVSLKDAPAKVHHGMDKVAPRPGEYEECIEVGETRIRNMDQAGIAMQVLSFSAPGVEAMEIDDAKEMAYKVNNELSKIISKYPDRYSGFATIASQDPEGAANELERAVKELGLRGVKINSHIRGEYLDNHKYWPIFARAEQLNVPVYLHPRSPSPSMIEPYLTYPILASAVWGFGAEVGLHAMRLICSGLFDEHPKLKIILGHLGEALPFWLWRIDDHRWDKADKPNPMAAKVNKKLSQYVKENFYVTTSGNFWMPAFMCTYMALGADRILFAVDYPMESSKMAIDLIENAPICDIDKEKIFHLNAENLLDL